LDVRSRHFPDIRHAEDNPIDLAASFAEGTGRLLPGAVTGTARRLLTRAVAEGARTLSAGTVTDEAHLAIDALPPFTPVTLPLDKGFSKTGTARFLREILPLARRTGFLGEVLALA
jgi:hypothetical protein